jgi:hypothetical protein
MSVHAFPMVPADEVALSTLCHNSLTDADVSLARAALQGLDPAWTLACCESCEADWFLDLSTARPLGQFDRFIIHARDAAVHVFAMAGDEYVRLGDFADMARAARAVVVAIAADLG